MAAAQQAEDDGTVTGINVTPLVDIMLVLLIIVMVTAKFANTEGLKVQLPKAAAAGEVADSALTVKMGPDGQLLLQDVAVDMNGLASQLAREAKLNPGVRVTLAADGRLPYQQIVTMLDAIKQAGVVRVALASEQ